MVTSRGRGRYAIDAAGRSGCTYEKLVVSRRRFAAQSAFGRYNNIVVVQRWNAFRAVGGGKSPHSPEVCSDAVVRVREDMGRSDARVCAYYDLRAGFFYTISLLL